MPAASLFRFMLLFSFISAAISLQKDEAGGRGEADGDRLALLAFKSKIAADASPALSSWNSSLDFCQWRGVTCGKQQQRAVTELDLDSFGLSGPISPSLANLTYLQRLSLRENHIHGHIPTELSSLPYLMHLDLGFNSLTGPIPSNLSRCAAIQTLDLSSNMLVGNIPDFLGNLSTLEELSLGENNFAAGGIPHSLETSGRS